MLRVDARDAVYWEASGNPEGKPAVVLHGGPGSGCTPTHRRFFDPRVYRIVLFDQRGCGRSRPHASDPAVDLSRNTTPHLIADLELLRQHLAIERWLVWGGSWSSTLALAYAQRHPERATELVLWGVTTGRRSEFDWRFRGGVATFLPEQWERLRAGADAAGDVVDAYARLLGDPDPSVHRPAARAWCEWETATLGDAGDRFRDPAFALAYARIVTHYVRHDAWLEDGELLRGAAALAGTPGVLVAARGDLPALLDNALVLKGAWPAADLVVVEGAHSPGDGAMAAALVAATDRFGGAPT